MANPSYIANRRLYLTADGRVVEARDPDKLTLLVPAGGALPLARARALGLAASAAVDVPQSVSTPAPEAAIEAQPAPGGEGTGVRRRAPQRRPKARE